MANQAPLGRPRLNSNIGNNGITRPGQTDASNTFSFQQFVSLSSGALVAYTADDTAIYGLTPDKSHAATDEPYTIPYGEVHNVIDPRNAQFVMNITDGSGTVGSGSTTQGDVTIGTRYSATYLGSVDTSCLAVDASDSGTATKNIFRVVGKLAADAAADFNGRVIVEILPSAIQ